MSPVWQSSTRQIESRVVNRVVRARPFFKTATFAGVMPTALAESPTDISRWQVWPQGTTMPLSTPEAHIDGLRQSRPRDTPLT